MEKQLKDKLKDLIENGDDKLLKLMYAVAKEYNSSEDDFGLTEAQLAEIERRRESRLNGQSSTFEWEKVKEIISASTSIK